MANLLDSQDRWLRSRISSDAHTMTQPNSSPNCNDAVFRAALALCCLLPTMPHAQIIKCVDAAGNVQFSNLGCASTTSGRIVEVRPNTVDMSGMRRQNQVLMTARQREIATQSPQAMQSGAGGGNTCPSELDIRNMGVSATSQSLTKKEQEFHQAEIRRASDCRRGEGNYAASDWRVSKEALDAQRSVSAEVRKKERARSEAMHAAANPAEGERIREERAIESARVDARRQAAAAAVAAAAKAQATQSSRLITSCKSTGCTTGDGQFYWNKGGQTFAGPNGFCRRVGDYLNCN